MKAISEVDPDKLVACVARIDELHGSMGKHVELPDLMMFAVWHVLEEEGAAVAACCRIQALALAIHARPDLLDAYPNRVPHLIPEWLTRAAAITPLERDSRFDAEALRSAALILRKPEGRA